MFEKQVSALRQGSLLKHVQKTDPSWRNDLRLSQKEVAQVQASEAEKLKALEANRVGRYHQVLTPKYLKDGSHSLSPQWAMDTSKLRNFGSLELW